MLTQGVSHLLEQTRSTTLQVAQSSVNGIKGVIPIYALSDLRGFLWVGMFVLP